VTANILFTGSAPINSGTPRETRENVASFHRRFRVNKRLCFLLATVLIAPIAMLAQENSQPAATPPANPITVSERGLYGFISGAVVRAAEKMPEENYSFKPTPEVRSFGQLVGHVADANYMFCSQAAGEPNPAKNIEKTKTSKADLVAALKDAVAYCNKTFDSMTDSQGSQMVKFFNFNLAKLTLLSLNTAHTDEHYGNMVTYLRIKGIVPPTSENQSAPPPKQPK
jgi:uncharacterized damage-inducible protein DinB